MNFDWEALQQSALVEERIAAGDHAAAIPILESELNRRPDDDHVVLQLADSYAHVGRTPDAVRLLSWVAERYAAADRPEKSIAVIKKIIRLDPSRKEVYELVASAMEGVEPGTASSFVYIDADATDAGASSGAAPPAGDETFSARRPIRLTEKEEIDNAVPSPLFDSFSHKELLAVMEGLELQVFDPGDIIVSEGDAGDSLFIVATGIVKAFVHEGDRQRRVRTLNDGDFFGEISMLQGGKRTATVTAASHCELLELDRPTVDRITAQHPNVLRVLREYYEERIGNAK